MYPEDFSGDKMYPKSLYKGAGETVVVANADEEKAAAKDGYVDGPTFFAPKDEPKEEPKSDKKGK